AGRVEGVEAEELGHRRGPRGWGACPWRFSVTASRNPSFRCAAGETSRGLKPRARAGPSPATGGSRGRRLRAAIADDRGALRRRAHAPQRASCRRGRADGRQWSPGLRRRRVPEVAALRGPGAWLRAGRRQGLGGGETGTLTSVQRFGGSVNVHLHFHTLVLDGVFVREGDGTLRFHPASPPTDDDVHRVVARVRRRLERLGVTGTA